MRAVVRDRFGGPEVLRVSNVAEPVPERDEVVVQVHAASVNAVDLDHLLGRPYAVRPVYGWRNPRYPGLGADLAGTVVAIGPEVSTWRAGDAVWADLSVHGLGAFAEQVCAPERAFTARPAQLDVEQAACVPHSGTLAAQGLAVGRPGPGDRVLVNGAGGNVGPFAVRLAKRAGAEVIGVDTAERLALVRAAGADQVVDHREHDFADTGDRYDLILDMVAARPMRRVRKALTDRGVYVPVGGSLVRYAAAAALHVPTAVIGRRRTAMLQWRANHPATMAELARRCRAGELTVQLDRVVDLEQAPEAVRAVAERRNRGKVVIVPSAAG